MSDVTHASLQSDGSESRILSLQIARAVAANFVVLDHVLSTDKRHLDGTLPDFLNLGGYGVDLFFVISRFVMIMVSKRGARQFLFDRVTRIYPPFWIVSLAILAAWMVQPQLISPQLTGEVSIWKSFLLLPQRGQPLLVVAWTLVHEIYFYLVFAFVLWLRTPIAASMLVWGLLVLTCHPWALDPTTRLLANPMTFEFLMGVFAAILCQKWRKFAGTALTLGLGAILAAGLFCAWSGHASSYSEADWPRVLLFGIPSAFIVYGLAALDGKAATFSALASAGDWSYSTYLIHVPVLIVCSRAIALAGMTSAAGAILLLVGGTIASNIIAFGFYHTVERPSILFVRKHLSWLARGGPMAAFK